MAPTFGTGVSSLPPEGAFSPWGGPAATMAPTFGTGVSSLPPRAGVPCALLGPGAVPCLGRPGAAA